MSSIFENLPQRPKRTPAEPARRGVLDSGIVANLMMSALLYALAGLAVLVGTGAVWATAWLFTHFPHH